MTISSLLTLMGIWLAALVSPGPDIVQVIRVAPRSTRAGLLCAVGVFSGTVFWIVASLAGLSALITARPGVLSILQLLGGLFLLYMGVSSLRGAHPRARWTRKTMRTRRGPLAMPMSRT